MELIFDPLEIRKLYKPKEKSSNEDNGNLVIIGGSTLFHGAPILSLKVTSRIVDMVYFASPETSLRNVVDKVKASLSSFIWIPWEDVGAYIQKSDAVLIGPGFMRFKSEAQNSNLENRKLDGEGLRSRKITERLLKKYPNKKWVIDAGSLQVMDAEWIPKGTILTPNIKEFEMLFKLQTQNLKLKTINLKLKLVREKAKKHDCTIVLKGPETIVCSPNNCVIVKGGNAGMTKGGTGDVLAGLTVALYAKNEAFLAASCASFIEKRAAEQLFEKVGINYNADDLAQEIPETIFKLTTN
ncbi:NAD(P)H-hydrate dehydratase [Candidatus Woesebacteria bacterium RBG_13_34_9]|uniref:ADP-dependent (S)-NAD(P)H-hydrate dehydratase n=1 Tax=Candidatus Woesebacteria bacterium RBG_13_34_9 TaxID=1802477 RepID=A0A1F7X0A2_9BACT|nr:MAG: NAD(P)H-hydrate dehydratase [Candidatus Woesebacteria bacterium RBG_13_34_9]